MGLYFISDTHFGHHNIIEFEHRTRGHYPSVEAMNADLVNQWNALVSNEDVVYFLGDFSMKMKKSEMIDVLNQLNFKTMHVIYGNHDHKPFRQAIDECNKSDSITASYGERIVAEKMTFYLSHYPMVVGERPGLFSVHGHLHSLESPSPNYQINVGYDYTGKIGLSLNELIEIARDKDTIKHGRNHL